MATCKVDNGTTLKLGLRAVIVLNSARFLLRDQGMS